MPQFDEVMKSDLTKGFAIGIGAALLAPLAVSLLSGAGRPLARAVIKTGILLVEKGRETMAELGEVFDDLAAEAHADLREQQAGAHAAAAEATAEPAATTTSAAADASGE